MAWGGAGAGGDRSRDGMVGGEGEGEIRGEVGK